MIFKEFPSNNTTEQISEFAEKNHLHFKTAKILMQRGIDTSEKLQKFLVPSISDLRDPFLLDGMTECHNKIQDAINTNKRILLYGDYDVDGISAISILHKFLKDKVTNLNYFLPSRYDDGYGLTIATAKKVIEKYNPELIITVDCGITCVDEVEFLKQNGVDIIITDHHEPLDVLPNTIIVDPKTKNNGYGFSGLCGAGVALKVVQSFVGREALDEYLPICAIATVADIVPLIDENRTIVKLGLQNQDKLPAGILKLAKNTKITEINSQAISFKIAPRLNAGGRMGNAYTALDLFLSNDNAEISKSLNKLLEQNTQRQQLSQSIYDDCIAQIQANKLYEKKAIFLKNEKWDSGLLGIACARLVDDFHKPVFLFSQAGTELKGSVRSIENINIHSLLSNCSSNLQTFGGHSMAAGLSLDVNNYQSFVEEVFNYLNVNTTKQDYFAFKSYDAELSEKELTLKFAKELELLEPFGCDNPIPQFLVKYNTCGATKLGSTEMHLNITIGNAKFICFNANQYYDDYVYTSQKQSLVELSINEFKGREYLKGILKYTNFYGITKQIDNIAKGRVIKQLYKDSESNKKINFFAEEQISEILNNNLQDSGVAIIINNFETYQKYQTILDKYMLNYYVGGSQSKLDENCVVFALDTIFGVSNYKKLIFLDGLYGRSFLNDFEGEIYSIQSPCYALETLNTERSYFGIVFNAIKQILTSKTVYRSELDLYKLVKESSKNIKYMSYSQFVFTLYVFLELNLLRKNEQFGYEISINNNVKSNLENSNLYNKIRFFQKIK